MLACSNIIVSYTLHPLQLDGRVKTLHPNVHGGILARRDQEHHMEALNNHGIGMLTTFYLIVFIEQLSNTFIIYS